MKSSLDTSKEYAAIFFVKESYWEGDHTSYVWQNYGAAGWRVIGETACFYAIQHGESKPKKVKKENLSFVNPEEVAAPIELAPEPVAAPIELAPLSPVHPSKKPYDSRPTEAQFTALQSMFDYFNAELFNNELPQCILNLSRMAKAYGFFAPNRWAGRTEAAAAGTWEDENHDKRMHEISLNPEALGRDAELVLGTLVHEMCHLQRQITGTPPRKLYHDKQWAEMMVAVGLTPSSTGAPGGKTTGQKVSHYINKPGRFYSAFLAMPSEYLLPFAHIAITPKEKAKKAASKLKYTCPGCESNVWGKPGLNITCGDCEEAYKAEEVEQE